MKIKVSTCQSPLQPATALLSEGQGESLYSANIQHDVRMWAPFGSLVGYHLVGGSFD